MTDGEKVVVEVTRPATETGGTGIATVNYQILGDTDI